MPLTAVDDLSQFCDIRGALILQLQVEGDLQQHFAWCRSALLMWSAGVQGCYFLHAITCNRTLVVCADETRWIDEQLGNLTASRVYVVEHDAAKREHCQRERRLSAKGWQPAQCSVSACSIIPDVHWWKLAMTLVSGLVELTARNATAAVAAGCWPHLATGSGREASVYLQVGARSARAGWQRQQWPAACVISGHIITAVRTSMVAQGPSSLRYVHTVWAAGFWLCMPDMLHKIHRSQKSVGSVHCLQYIVEEWDRLPESVLFIHGHE